MTGDSSPVSFVSIQSRSESDICTRGQGANEGGRQSRHERRQRHQCDEVHNTELARVTGYCVRLIDRDAVIGRHVTHV